VAGSGSVLRFSPTLGFRFKTEAPAIAGGIALLLLIGYAFSWIFAFIGLTATSPEAANAYGFTTLFPLTFVSSAFVPVASMPSWLQPVAEHNPFTTMSTPSATSSSTLRQATTSGSRRCGRCRRCPIPQ
jgi:ABC-type multidrug transport system permease subunit